VPRNQPIGGPVQASAQRVRHSETSNFLILATAQLAVPCRKPEISRTLCSIDWRNGREAPYGSRPCEPHSAHVPKSALPVALRGKAVGRSGGFSKSGALRSIRSADARLSLRSLGVIS